MTESSTVVEFLVRSLQQVNSRPLKGSQLSVLVKTSFPDFSPEAFGYRTLREFIRKNVPEIMELGRVGMDVSYCLKSSQPPLDFGSENNSAASPANDQLATNIRAWKTFTTPDSPFRLYLTDQGVLRTLHSNSRPLPEWREIRRMSSDSLLQIAKDFVATLDEFQKDALAPLLLQPKWWLPFFDRLQPLNLKSKWIEFRRKRIREEFQQKLDEIDIAPATQSAAITTPPLAVLAEPVPQTQSELSIRKIAGDVVKRMTESELRALNLPLGYVVDSLTTR